MRMIRNSLAAALAAATLAAIPAHAQTAAADAAASVPVHMDLTAHTALKGALDKVLDDGQINMIHAVAHQQVVALRCKGFKIDRAKFESEMDLIYDDDKGQPKKLTPAEHEELEKKALFGFGLAFGAQLAISSYDEAAFCANAEDERKEPASGHAIWAQGS